MKLILSCCLSLFVTFCFSQDIKLRKKYLKNYKGIISSYEVNYNNNLVKIEASEINIQLNKDSVYISIGSSKWVGTYTTIKSGKKSYELRGKMQGSGVLEVLSLNTKEKKIIRKGLFPQPDAELNWNKN